MYIYINHNKLVQKMPCEKQHNFYSVQRSRSSLEYSKAEDFSLWIWIQAEVLGLGWITKCVAQNV